MFKPLHLRTAAVSLLIAALLFSCKADGEDVTYEEMTTSEMAFAISVVTGAFERNLDASSLKSFVLDGKSLTENDKGEMEFESSIYIEFDGDNKFYRKDVIDGETPESYEEWNGSTKKWLIVSTSSEERESKEESDIYHDFISAISLQNDELSSMKADEKFVYTLEKEDKTIKLGFSKKLLTYIDILYGKFQHSFNVRDYDSKISITIPS